MAGDTGREKEEESKVFVAAANLGADSVFVCVRACVFSSLHH